MKKIIRGIYQRNIVLILLLGIVFLLVAVKIVNAIDYRNSDFFSFWLAGRMMWTGQDPYLTDDWILGHNQFDATWISDPNFLYPLPLALFFAPLGWLPLYYAFIVWIFLLESMIFFSAISLINLGDNPQKKHFIVPILVSILIFRPAIIAVLNGQISGFLLFVMVCVILLWNKSHWVLGGAALAIVALKPNIGIPIIALVSLWLLFNKKINSLAGVAASGLALVLLGLAAK